MTALASAPASGTDLNAGPPVCVCVVGLRGIPNVMGGVETHCEELYPRLKQQFGDRVRIVILARSCYLPEAGTFEGVEIVPVYAPRHKYLETIVHTTLAIMAARWRQSADIVHIHAIGPALLAQFAALLGLKIVVTHHGEDFQRAKWNGFAKWMLRTGEKMAVRWSDRLIVISHALERRIAAEYGVGPEKTAYIPNGVTLGDQPPADGSVLAEFGLERGGYIVGVGRLVPEKGFQDLILAHKAAGSAARPLVIVGDADHRDRFAQELMRGAGEDVVFTGRIPRAKVLALLRNTALFVLPSYHEGLPFVALEAIAAGAPLVLSSIPGNLELDLAPEGYFAPGDIAAIGARLVADSDRFRADPAILERYDWTDIAARTGALYQSLFPRGR